MRVDSKSAAGKLLATFYQEEVVQNNALRADLKRCQSANEVMMTPGYYSLRRRFEREIQSQPWFETRLAIVAGLMGHLANDPAVLAVPRKDKDGDQTAIDVFIRPLTEGVGRPLLSELRFRRLLQRDPDELFIALIRVLRMLKGKANLYGLAESVFHWGDATKRNWAKAYFPRVPSKKSN